MKPKLLSCPFCGGEGRIEQIAGEMPHFYPIVKCAVCRNRGLPAYTEAEAVEAWNTRAAPATDEVLIEAVARALIEQRIRINRKWDTDPAALEAMLPTAIDMHWHEEAENARKAIAAMQAHITAREQAIRDEALDEAWQAAATATCNDTKATQKRVRAAILALKEQYNG